MQYIYTLFFLLLLQLKNHFNCSINPSSTCKKWMVL